MVFSAFKRKVPSLDLYEVIGRRFVNETATSSRRNCLRNNVVGRIKVSGILEDVL